MLKPIFEITEGERAKYYRGVLIESRATPDDNWIIETEDTEILHLNNGCVVASKCNHNISRFIVPKRRPRVIHEIQCIEIGKKIVIKLLYEKLSGKFAVSSIGIV